VILRQCHSTIYVIDQQEALEFYRDTLGFEVNTDMPMGDSGPRWLTVSPKGQPDLELVLAELTPGPMFDAETAEGKIAGREGRLRYRRLRNGRHPRRLRTPERARRRVRLTTQRTVLRHRGHSQRQLRGLVQPHRAQEIAGPENAQAGQHTPRAPRRARCAPRQGSRRYRPSG
jgi:hypothetical protein